MAVEMVKAGSYDWISGSDYQFKEVTDANQYFYRYDPQRFIESLQSGHVEILSVFPCPSEILSSIQRSQYFYDTICI